MKCLICKWGELHSGKTTLTFERDRMILVVKGIPALVCGNCGEAYVDEKTTAHLLRLADEADASGVQVDVREYVAA